MEQITINLSANNQNLTIDKILEITDDTVRYVHAVVDLGDNWEFDSIRAIWTNGISVSTVLNNGECDVPAEVLDHIGVVKVNLVGSDIENNELIDRLPTWQIPCILVKQDVPIDGTDPQPITPSEYEQFVKAVKDNADRAEQAESNAQGYASDSQGYAQNASESATSAHDDKIAIEQAIAEVIQQIEDFEQVQVVVNTLPPSSQATSDFTDGVLTLGIPQGVKGDTGNGIQSITKTGTSGLVDTYTITFTDGQTTTFNVTNGAKGDTGNGIASIEKTSTVGLVDTYTITYTNGTTTTFTVTNGEKGDKGEQGEAGGGAVGTVASAYSASKTYAVGDYVIHNSNLYRCTTSITTAEAFNSAHWTQVVLGDDVTDLKSALNATENLLIGEGASDVFLWESGSISGKGGNTANTARIRTKTYLWFGYSEGHLAVTCSNTYEMFFAAYDKDSKEHQGCIQTDMKIGTGTGAWLQSVNLINYPNYVFRVVLRNKANPTATMDVAYGAYVYFEGEKYGLAKIVNDLNGKQPYVYSTQAITVENGIYDKLNNFSNTGHHASVSVNAGEKYLITAKCYPSNDYPMYLFRKSGSVVGYKNIASAQFVLDEATVPDGADELLVNSSSSLIEVKKGTAVASKPYSKWQGKKIAWFGTSIPETSTYNAVLGYPEYVGKLLGATVYNESRGSSCARRGFKSAQSANDPYGWTGMGYKGALYNMGSTHAEKQSMIDDWEDKWKALVGGDHTLTDGDKTLAMYYSYETVLQQHITTPVDLYVFDHGYNDWSANPVNMEMNENDPYDRSTYQGAMNTFINLILTANPRAKIVLISHYETQERPTLVPMQKSVAEYWNLPFCKVCDYLGWANDRTVTTDGYWSNGTGNGVWISSGGASTEYTLKELHIPDGRHPNLDISGHACIDIADIIADFINTITPTN